MTSLTKIELYTYKCPICGKDEYLRIDAYDLEKYDQITNRICSTCDHTHANTLQRLVSIGVFTQIEEKSLPNLVGTAKQVLWALALRFNYATDEDINNVSSKYWIETYQEQQKIDVVKFYEEKAEKAAAATVKRAITKANNKAAKALAKTLTDDDIAITNQQ